MKGLRKTGLDPTSGNLPDSHFSNVDTHKALIGDYPVLIAAYERHCCGSFEALAADPTLLAYGLNLSLMMARPSVNGEDFAKFAVDETYTVGGNPGGGFEGIRSSALPASTDR